MCLSATWRPESGSQTPIVSDTRYVLQLQGSRKKMTLDFKETSTHKSFICCITEIFQIVGIMYQPHEVLADSSSCPSHPPVWAHFALLALHFMACDDHRLDPNNNNTARFINKFMIFSDKYCMFLIKVIDWRVNGADCIDLQTVYFLH